MSDMTRDEMIARARLHDLAQVRGVSLKGLSEMLGKNSAYLQQFMTRGTPRRLQEDDRRTLAEFFGVAETELGGPEEKSSRRASRGDWVDVPRLPLGASAGPGALAAEEQAFDGFRFSRRWLREQGLGDAQLSAITVEGDSMEPVLRDGDEVLVDRTPRPFQDGIYVLRHGEALLVKRVSSRGAGRFLLVSANKAYPPIEVSAGEIDIIGRVVWKGGRV
ncbi:S24 family peptidase [Qipengyuania sp. JC766]|uniref:S24 family peptidase n=1 Tax=Qipengyuania sp. JC766 TaxID=3232139 RepID=UPI0034596FB2